MSHPYPPGPKASHPFAMLLAIRQDRLKFFRDLASYGDIAYLEGQGQQFFLFNHPQLIQDVLVTHSRNFVMSRALQFARRFLGNGLLTSEGEFHLRQRRLVQPAFHRQRMAAYGEVMTRCADRTAHRWQSLGHGATVDMSAEMMRLTLAIVGKTLFDADVEDEAPEIGQALTEELRAFNRLFLPGGQLLEKLPLPANRRVRAARKRLDVTVYRLISERRAGGEDRGDLLSMLLEAQDELGDGGGMTDEQVRDEAMTLFLAGHETTANALAWTWYLLAQAPQAEERLHHELDQVLAGRLPTMEDIARLTYTRQVLSESMRLFPPAYVIGRQALEDYPVREYLVPAGATVFMSQYVTHRDPRYWPDAERFDPDRWTAEAQAERPKFAYFPFGGGPRLCIGESFAWAEGILVLATLAQRWQARLVPGEPIETEPLITLRPRRGMPMTLRERTR